MVMHNDNDNSSSNVNGGVSVDDNGSCDNDICGSGKVIVKWKKSVFYIKNENKFTNIFS